MDQVENFEEHIGDSRSDMQHSGAPTVYPHTGMKDKRMTAEDIRSYGKSNTPHYTLTEEYILRILKMKKALPRQTVSALK